MSIKIKQATVDVIGLIRQEDDGIYQLGMSTEQSTLLQLFLAGLSKEKPFIKLNKMEVKNEE